MPPGPVSVSSRLASSSSLDLLLLAPPPDERGELGREVVAGVLGPQWREPVLEARRGELEDVLWLVPGP